MNVNFEGVYLFTKKVNYDSRGFFTECFKKTQLDTFNLNLNFLQDNISLSYPNVIRGLHSVVPFIQSKYIMVLLGKINVVILDLKQNSQNFGKYVSFELSFFENPGAVYISPGYAFGFSVISETPAILYYKVTTEYNKDSEIKINPLDPILNIDWKVSNPILSNEDKNAMSWEDFKKGVKNV